MTDITEVTQPPPSLIHKTNDGVLYLLDADVS